jgi:CubicO group peptidase (beta-lactamase class C family)
MTSIGGDVASGFEPVADAFKANFDEGAELGAGFAAIVDGEVVVNIFGGHLDRGLEHAWTADTLVPVHSTTKGIAAIVVARLVDDGLISYDDLVTQVWPEFGAHGKDQLSIGQALSHQAGLAGFADPIDQKLWLDPSALAAKLAAAAPLWPPGTASGYHPLTWGYIVGEIAKRASGRSLGTILSEDICAPLGADFRLGLPDSEAHRCATMQKPKRIADFGEITPIKRAAFLQPWSNPPRDDPQWRRVEIPSANGHGTALAVAQLYSVYANEGGKVLSRAGFHALTAQQIEGDDLVIPFRLDWRAGVMGNAQGFYGPNRGAYGHSGAGGSCGFGDPTRRVSAGYVMNKQSHHIMGDPRSLRLNEALYSCLG